jgi:hypothetical protein
MNLNNKLITMSGSLNTSTRQYNKYNPTMDGFWSSLGNVISAPFKAVGKTYGEIYRGAKSGDIMRIFTAPVKGVTHGVMTTGRGLADLPGAEIIAGIGTVIPGPWTPFALGATLAIRAAKSGRSREAQAKYEIALQQEYETQAEASKGGSTAAWAVGAAALAALLLAN